MKFKDPAPEYALVHNWDDRLRIASLLTSRIRVREGQIARAKALKLKSISPSDCDIHIEELQTEIISIQGSWKELLGVEYPAVF